MAWRVCGQCGRRTLDGAYGVHESDFEGQWYCRCCWDDWGEQDPELEPAFQAAEPSVEEPAPRFPTRQAFGFGPQAAPAQGTAGSSQEQSEASAPFSRKAFSWTKRGREPPAVAPPQPADKTQAALLNSRQAFEVLQTCTVREEPDVESRTLRVKPRGSKVWGGEITFDGWLRLHGESGWILTQSRCSTDGAQAFLEMLPSEGAWLAIEGFQSQGICCLEVSFVQVVVREFPSRSAPVLSTRYQGELVFARAQSFDGWFHLAGEPGWMLGAAEEYGQLLTPLYDLPHVDLWLLRDLWASARGEEGELASQIVPELKDAEARATLLAAQAFSLLDFDEELGRWRVPETHDCDLLQEGLLREEDLEESHARILRKLFAGALERALTEDPLRTLVPWLRRSERPVLLPVGVGDEDAMGEMPGPYGATMLVEHLGQVYSLAAGGLLLDPETQHFVGLWDAEAKTVLPPPEGFDPSGGLEILKHEGRDYVMTANGIVFDPITRRRVGTFSPETQSVELAEAQDADGVQLKMAWEGPLDGASVPGSKESEDLETCLARAKRYLERRSFGVAAREFARALQICERSSCVDLDEEAAIVRQQVSCHCKLREFSKVLVGAERLLTIDAADRMALEWKQLALREIGGSRPTGR